MNTFIRQKAEADRQVDRQTNKQWQHNNSSSTTATSMLGHLLLLLMCVLLDAV